jgi:tetratricopeptide (TPR) repeat protein
MMFAPLVAVAALLVQSSPADTLRLLAYRLPASALVMEVRSRPLAIRDAVTELRQAVKGQTGVIRAEQLDVARQLSAAYAAAWRDSFLVREVERFAAWPPLSRAGKVWADSVRRAGVAAYGRDGPTTAIVIWRRGLRRAIAISDTAGMAALSGNIGAAFLEEGALDSALMHLERARSLATAVGDVRVEGNATGTLAGLREESGDVVAARDLYARALVLRERIDDSRGMAADHNNLGLLAQTLGDLDEAERHFQAALAINRRDGREDAAATNQLNLAGLATLAGDFTRAAALYRNALASWRGAERWADAAAALHGLGQLEVRRGNYVGAVTALREALAILERTGPRTDALLVQRDLAGALAAQGDLQGALDELRSAQRTTDAGIPVEARAGLLLAQADLAVQLNAPADAERLYARAEFLYRQSGHQTGVADAQEGRGVLLFARGNSTRAQTLIESAMRAHASAGNQRAAALARVWLAKIRLQRGDTTAARMHLARAESDLTRAGDPVASAVATGERAALEAAAGFSAVAESLYRAGLQRVGDRPAPDVVWPLHAGLALALRGRNDVEGAVRELRAATREIERSSRSFTLAERRSAFLLDKWDVYAQLARTRRCVAGRTRRSKRPNGCGPRRCSSCSRAAASWLRRTPPSN